MAKTKKPIDTTTFWCMWAFFGGAVFCFVGAMFYDIMNLTAVFVIFGILCAFRLRSPITLEETYRPWDSLPKDKTHKRKDDKIDEDAS